MREIGDPRTHIVPDGPYWRNKMKLKTINELTEIAEKVMSHKMTVSEACEIVDDSQINWLILYVQVKTLQELRGV